jgi:hypothetical protein
MSGSGPGQVWQPHGIAIDAQDACSSPTARTIASRLTPTETSSTSEAIAAPAESSSIRKPDTIYVVDSESSPMNHPDWPGAFALGASRPARSNISSPEQTRKASAWMPRVMWHGCVSAMVSRNRGFPGETQLRLLRLHRFQTVLPDGRRRRVTPATDKRLSCLRILP